MRFVAGAAASIAVLMFYQWSSFGNPIFPAQVYIPVTNFADRRGYYGFELPQPDLLWATAFNIRYGLFTSAPLLLLACWVPRWFHRGGTLLARRETLWILAFSVAWFVFCSASQRGRMQFNCGVRHIVPVTPFMFLLAANTLLYMPRVAAVTVGALGMLWSWSQAMYREVEFGWGVIEAPKHILTEGLQLPWLSTLRQLGYVNSPIPLVVVLSLGITAILLIWGIRRPKESGWESHPLPLGRSS